MRSIWQTLEERKRVGETMLRDEIKSVLARKGLTNNEYAKALDVQPPSLSRKLKEESFSYHDLKTLAVLTKSTLCLLDPITKEVIATLTE